MQFLMRTTGNFLGIWLAVLITGAPASHPNHGFISTLLVIALLAVTLAAVDSLPNPLAQIFPLGLYIAIFALFAVSANTIILSLTEGFSSSVSLPIVLDSWASALTGGVITGVISTAIMMWFYRHYRE